MTHPQRLFARKFPHLGQVAPRINGTWIDERTRCRLDAAYGVRVFDGDFWYDPACGAWGIVGGPTAGFAPSGLPLGVPPANRSGTELFVNGRELHALDVRALSELIGLAPGRYRLDRFGTLAFERGHPFMNLATIAKKRGPQAGGAWNACGREPDKMSLIRRT